MRFFILLFAFLTLTANADEVYRCNVGGKTVYASSCPDGAQVKIWHGPGVADVASAKSQSEIEKKTLRRHEKVQKKQDAKAEKARRRRAKKLAKKKKKCDSFAQKMRWAEEDARRAHFKKRENAQRKVKRATEKYELECGA